MNQNYTLHLLLLLQVQLQSLSNLANTTFYLPNEFRKRTETYEIELLFALLSFFSINSICVFDIYETLLCQPENLRM